MQFLSPKQHVMSLRGTQIPCRDKHPTHCLDRLTLSLAVWVHQSADLYLSLVLFIDLDVSIQHSAVSKSEQHDVAGKLWSGNWNSEDQPLSGSQSLAHRMHVFRMRLLHFVNSLHDYVMTRVKSSCCAEILACAVQIFSCSLWSVMGKCHIFVVEDLNLLANS